LNISNSDVILLAHAGRIRVAARTEFHAALFQVVEHCYQIAQAAA
jgi:hypothetical protein